MNQLEPIETRDNKYIWQAVKVFLADVGLSSAIGFVVGFLGAFLIGNLIFNSSVLLVLGFVFGIPISSYMAFLLHKKYSSNKYALVTLLSSGVVYGAVSLLGGFISGQASVLQEIILIVASLVAYLIGWYVAEKTNFKVFLLSNKWVTGFMIVGLLVLVFKLIQFLQ